MKSVLLCFRYLIVKKLFLLAGFFFVFVQFIHGEKIEGYYITKSGDTITALLIVPIDAFYKTPDFELIQHGIKYFDSTNNKQFLDPEKNAEFSFEYKNVNYRMISVLDNLHLKGIVSDKKYIFLRLITDGKLRLFAFYEEGLDRDSNNPMAGITVPSSAYRSEVLILQKAGRELIKPFWASFIKDMTAYLSDCPVVVEKIESKVFKQKDVKKIVDEYNSKCR